MPTINEWRGDAPAVAQVTTLTCPDINGVVEFYLGDRPLGWAREWRTAATSDDPELMTAALVTFWNRSRLGEYGEVAASAGVVDGVDVLILTAREAGRPFTVTTTIGGSSSANESQIVTVHKATGGTTVLTFDGQSTSALAITASAATVQSALEALGNLAPGDVAVTLLATGSWKITFQGAYAGTDVPVITASTSSLTGGDCQVVVTLVSAGVPGINAVQVISLPGSPTSGTFTVGYPGQVATLNYNSSAGSAQTALEAVFGEGNVAVTGGNLPGTALTVTFIGELAGTTPALLQGDGAGLGASSSLAVDTLTTGVPGTNHSIRINLAEDPSVPNVYGKTGWTMTFFVLCGQSVNQYWRSARFSYTDSASSIQLKLEEMVLDAALVNPGPYVGNPSFLGVGNVVVTGSLNNSWSGGGGLTITLGGVFHSTPIPLMGITQFQHADGTQLSTSLPSHYGGRLLPTHTILAAGTAGTNEKQRITQTGYPTGSFRITFNGVTSLPINYCTSAGATPTNAELSAWLYSASDALASLTTAGVMGPYQQALSPPHRRGAAPVPGVHVSQPCVLVTPLWRSDVGKPSLEFTFRSGGLQSTNHPQLTVSESGSEVAVEQTVTGVPAVSERQQISLTGSPWGGTFTLTHIGQTTAALGYQSSATALRLGLEALSNLVPGDLAITGTGPWLVVFSERLGNVPLLSGVGTGLHNGSIEVVTQRDGGTSVEQSTTQRSRGPWHGDDPFNWTLGHAPQRGEFPLLMFGDTGPRWGITWLAAFTRDAVDTALLHVAASDFQDDQCVEVRSSGSLPSGLSAATAYYVRDLDRDAGTLRLAGSAGGSPVAISGGSGTHEIFVPLAGLKTKATWRGWIGNTVIDKSGKFRDYRPIYLKCGWQPGARITLGEGPGSASPLTRINTGTFPVDLEILHTAGPTESDLPSVLLVCQHASTHVEVLDGDMGLALLAGETSLIHHLILRDGEAQLGEGVTFASGGYLDVTGGQLSSLASLTGVLKIRG